MAQSVVGAGQVQFTPDVEAAIRHVMPPLMTLQRISAAQNLTGWRYGSMKAAQHKRSLP